MMMTNENQYLLDYLGSAKCIENIEHVCVDARLYTFIYVYVCVWVSVGENLWKIDDNILMHMLCGKGLLRKNKNSFLIF